MDAEEIGAFRSAILDWYSSNRRSFPWRETRDPWDILVSEVMLQQTQTLRVLSKYRAFLEAFPKPGDLAKAPVAELLGLWSGLGYNRRALALKRCAENIEAEYGGMVPDDEGRLLALPGVGPYTARAVLAFAWGKSVTLIETNIRAVFIEKFFPGSGKVADREIAPLVEATLDRSDPRNWYYALMDYGVAIKKEVVNPGRRSASYARQSSFVDSHRRIRGTILKVLGARAEDAENLAASLPFARERVDRALGELVAEGFVEEYRGEFRLRGSKISESG